MGPPFPISGNRRRDGSEELYDHENDPLEWTNLADDPKFAQTKQQLAVSLPKVNAENAAFDKNLRRGKRKKTKK